jgi:hypothetical protein
VLQRLLAYAAPCFDGIISRYLAVEMRQPRKVSWTRYSTNFFTSKTNEMANVTTQNWKAWVNKQPIQPTPGGTLHVIGEVDTQSTDQARLIKKVPQGINPKILSLELQIGGFVPAKNPQLLHYSQGLVNESYTSIDIFYNNAIVATIKDILVID